MRQPVRLDRRCKKRSPALDSSVAPRSSARHRRMGVRIVMNSTEAGSKSKEAEKERFFSLASQLSESSDFAERQRIKRELARVTFGE